MWATTNSPSAIPPLVGTTSTIVSASWPVVGAVGEWHDATAPMRVMIASRPANPLRMLEALTNYPIHETMVASGNGGSASLSLVCRIYARLQDAWRRLDPQNAA